MKKLGFALVALFCFSILGATGCGSGGEGAVIEAPATEEDGGDPIEGISDEDYTKAMDEQMNQPGN